MLDKHAHWISVALAVLCVTLCFVLVVPMLDARGPDVEQDVVFESFEHAPDLSSTLDEAADKVSSVIKPDVRVPEASAVTIVVDDLGYDLAVVKRLVALPFPVAISVLPFSPYARQAAEIAHDAGRVVMLHMPMAPERDHYRQSMVDGFLHEDMDEEQVRGLLEKALERVPHVAGINNHMGSALTSSHEHMRWVMSFCQERGLFFIDSRTKANSVAAEEARNAGIKWAERSVFLDHEPELPAMRSAWEHAMAKAVGRGAIVIGHPHANTLTFLEGMIPENEQQRITMVNDLLHAPAI